MASKLKSFLISNLAGGINKYLDDFEIKDNESPDMKNMDFFGVGALKKRRGYIKLGTGLSNHPTGIFQYKTTSKKEVLVMDGDTLKKYSGGGWVSISGFTFTSGKDTNACQAGGKLYLSNGTDNLVQYNGTSLTELTGDNTCVGKWCVYYDNRLFCQKASNPDRLYFSGTGVKDGNAPDFSAGGGGGYLEFLPGSGAVITGAFKFGNYLYVLLEDAIYRLSPAETAGDYNVELVVKALGTTSFRTIQQVGNDVLFLTHEGVVSFGEVANYLNLRITDLGSRVKPILDTAGGEEKEKACAVYFDHKYYLAFRRAGQTYNSELVVYDTRYKAWLYWDNIRANQFLVYIDSDNNRHLYFADDNTANVYELGVGLNDDGDGIDAYIYTKKFDMGDFSIEKLIMDCSILFGNVYGTIDVEVITDDGAVAQSLTMGEESDSGGIGRYMLGYKQIGEFGAGTTTSGNIANDWRYFDVGQDTTMVQLKFSNSEADEDFQIKKILLTFKAFPHYMRDDIRYVG